MKENDLLYTGDIVEYQNKLYEIIGVEEDLGCFVPGIPGGLEQIKKGRGWIYHIQPVDYNGWEYKEVSANKVTLVKRKPYHTDTTPLRVTDDYQSMPLFQFQGVTA